MDTIITTLIVMATILLAPIALYLAVIIVVLCAIIITIPFIWIRRAIDWGWQYASRILH